MTFRFRRVSVSVLALSVEGELVLFLLADLLGGLFCSFNLLMTSLRRHKVSLLNVLVGIGVPEAGVLNADPVCTSRLFIATLRLVSLIFMVTQCEDNKVFAVVVTF